MYKRRFDYVFWDWNGTIIDDLYINFNVINTLLSNLGEPTVSLSEYRNSFTFPIKKFYNLLGLPTSGKAYEQLVYDYWRLYKSKAKDIPLMPRVLDVIATLKENGTKQYILSASNRNMVLEQMSIYGIQDFFEDAICPQNGYALGKVELAKQWISTQNISSTKVIMIGDTFHDWETAKAIDIDCALVNIGHQDLKTLMYNPDVIVFNNISELAETMFNIM